MCRGRAKLPSGSKQLIWTNWWSSRDEALTSIFCFCSSSASQNTWTGIVRWLCIYAQRKQMQYNKKNNNIEAVTQAYRNKGVSSATKKQEKSWKTNRIWFEIWRNLPSLAIWWQKNSTIPTSRSSDREQARSLKYGPWHSHQRHHYRPAFHPSIHCSMGSAPVGVQCPLTSLLDEFPGYWDWLWYPGL